jgi:DNA-binding transcriptional LysR family regulator
MKTTIDQWEVLEAVVELGSFGAAASKMNRSQSTISYAVSRLQDQFKNPLLEMKGRKAQLTEAGKALLADVEPLLSGFRALEQRAASLAAGGETEISLSVDGAYPDDRLFAALAELTRVYPHTHLKLHRGTFLSSVNEFAHHGADLCIVGTPTQEHLLKPVLDIRIRAVARADHPLNAGGRQQKRMDLIQRLAVVIEGTAGPVLKRQPHAPAQRPMTVTSIESAIEAVRSGLCFGWLPVYRNLSYWSPENWSDCGCRWARSGSLDCPWYSKTSIRRAGKRTTLLNPSVRIVRRKCFEFRTRIPDCDPALTAVRCK